MWSKRAKVTHTDTATLRRWLTDDGLYAVVEVRSHGLKERRYLAIMKKGHVGGEVIISRHRSRQAAIDACERDGRRRLGRVVDQLLG